MLSEHRFFDPDPGVRSIAAELYASVKALPIVSPHGHVEARLFAENLPFSDPAALIVMPDHYVFRMLHSQGIPLEALGIPSVDGTAVETDRRKIWRLFAGNYHLFAGTPAGAWLDFELERVFGVDEKLSAATADRIFDRIAGRLGEPAFLPRALFERFNIEVLATTDGAAESLDQHRKIRSSGWPGRVIPTFRPDDVTDILRPDWREKIRDLSFHSGVNVADFKSFTRALEERRREFKEMGGTAADHGVLSPVAQDLGPFEAESIFRRALKGKATAADAAAFSSHMLLEMARMSTEDGLVMQLHAGSFRNHCTAVFRRFGPDRGADIPVAAEFTRSLHGLLNRFGRDPRFTLVVFTLDESTYSRELAPLAGFYPALKIGAPWWFHDSFEGMMRFWRRVAETAGIYNTAGFADDTRSLPSIPARHDLARRADANFLAGLVARHAIDLEDGMRMIRALVYELPKKTYRLG